MACGYSKLEALDADYNAKIRFQFPASQPEKMPKKGRKMAYPAKMLNFGTY